MQRKEVRFVYDLVVARQFILLAVRPLHGPAHLLDNSPGQIADALSFNPTLSAALISSGAHWPSPPILRFNLSEVGFETDRRLVAKVIEAIEVEHCPDRFDTIELSTNFGIFQEP